MALVHPALSGTTTPVSDAALIAASLEDPHAFAALFERHFDRIHRWLHRRVGAPLAEDLAAETFTRAFDRRARFDPAYAEAAPWLFGIAANLVRDHARAEVRRLRALARAERWEPGDDDDPAASAAARADAARTGPALAAALAMLRQEERDVVLLIAWAELEYEAVARALGVPVGTVRSRLHRARRQLQVALQKPEDDR